MGAFGLVLLLITGELAPGNVLGFCVAASNAVGLIAGTPCCAAPPTFFWWLSWRSRQECPPVAYGRQATGVVLLRAYKVLTLHPKNPTWS